LGDASAGPAAPTGDPLAEHAALVRTLSAAVDELYERDGSDAVLHAVRRTVQEAAETETRTWRAARARWQAGLAEQELAGVTGTMVNSVRRKQS
jgi:dihydropteroate synthase